MAAEDFNSFGQAIVKKMIAEVAQANPHHRTLARSAAPVGATPLARSGRAYAAGGILPLYGNPLGGDARRQPATKATQRSVIFAAYPSIRIFDRLERTPGTHPVTAATGLKRLAIAVAAVVAAVVRHAWSRCPFSFLPPPCATR